MKRMLFILNPKAGQMRANRYLTQMLPLFIRGGYDVTVHITAFAGDAMQAAQRLAQEMDMVVCCGGDGTFNETLNGVMRSGVKVPIGYIPAGSTNDFARGLGIPTNVMAAARAVVEGTPRTLDVGKFGQRYFSYVASFGIFTRISYSTPQDAKNVLGHMAYLLGGIQELSQLRTTHMRFTVDGGRVVEDDFVFGAICNATSLGGVLTLDPKKVDLCDGRFELLLIRAPKDLAELADCVRALQTQNYNNKHITFLSASCIMVQSHTDMNWTLDGEQESGQQEVMVENLHNAMQVVLKG